MVEFLESLDESRIEAPASPPVKKTPSVNHVASAPLACTQSLSVRTYHTLAPKADHKTPEKAEKAEKEKKKAARASKFLTSKTKDKDKANKS